MYLNLYNQVKTLFQAKGFRNAEILFKYYYQYLENTKKNIINKNEIDTCIYQFLATRSLSAQKIKVTIENALSIEEFFENAGFKTELYNRAKSEKNFFDTFYENFSETDKQQLIVQWIPSNGNRDMGQFEEILEKIHSEIPNISEFANSILSATNEANNLLEKEKLYDVFFKLNLPGEYDYALYSQQVISSICSTDIKIHTLGIDQYSLRGQFVKTEKLKETAIPFLFSIITNLNTYHIIFENILNLKIGIDKRQFDKQICDTSNCVSYISDYLIQSGDLDFYKTVISKLLDYTISIIKERFIMGINYQPKYLEILKVIDSQSNKKDFPEKVFDKLKSLLSSAS